jgi:hypothetical protein
MKAKMARILRKWADVLVPPVKATPQAISFRIEVDSRDAIKEIERVRQAMMQVYLENIVEERNGNRRLRQPVDTTALPTPSPEKNKPTRKPKAK